MTFLVKYIADFISAGGFIIWEGFYEFLHITWCDMKSLKEWGGNGIFLGSEGIYQISYCVLFVCGVWHTTACFSVCSGQRIRLLFVCLRLSCLKRRYGGVLVF